MQVDDPATAEVLPEGQEMQVESPDVEYFPICLKNIYILRITFIRPAEQEIQDESPDVEYFPICVKEIG